MFTFDVPLKETVFYKEVFQEGYDEGYDEGFNEAIAPMVKALYQLQVDPGIIAKALELAHAARRKGRLNRTSPECV